MASGLPFIPFVPIFFIVVHNKIWYLILNHVVWSVHFVAHSVLHSKLQPPQCSGAMNQGNHVWEEFTAWQNEWYMDLIHGGHGQKSQVEPFAA